MRDQSLPEKQKPGLRCNGDPGKMKTTTNSTLTHAQHVEDAAAAATEIERAEDLARNAALRHYRLFRNCLRAAEALRRLR
jgi:hypothetical protein